MHPKQIEIFRSMTPDQKIEMAGLLYQAARELKAAGIRAQHPDWPDARVFEEVRRIFSRAHT